MVAPDNLVESPMDRAESKGDQTKVLSEQVQQINLNKETDSTNIQSVDLEREERQPSYVALACCISGYTTLHYDSKARQGLRSTQISPRSRSPINENGNITQHANYKSDCGRYLTAMPHELNPNMQSQSQRVEVLSGCDSLNSATRHISRMSLTSESRANFTSPMITKKFNSCSSSSTHEHYTHYISGTDNNSYSASISPYSPANGEYVNANNGSRLIAATKAPGQVSPSSFIVQRVERLYGPGALAQGFYSPRRILDRPAVSNSQPHSLPAQTPRKSGENGFSDSEDSLPVLKLLRPEFRAQLTVASRKSMGTPPQQSLMSTQSLSPTVINSNSRETCEDGVIEKEKLGTTDNVDASLRFPIHKIKQMDRDNEIKDGHYFLKLLDSSVSQLEQLAIGAEANLETCTSDEGSGILRAFSGKARLLVAEKLNQFRGLCFKNLKQTKDEDFPTTNEDLAGFWDMVLIQINQIIDQFDEIEKLKKNDWKSDDIEKRDIAGVIGNRVLKKIPPVIRKPTDMNSAVSKARDEARRKLIEEKRKAMKSIKKADQSDETVIIV